MPDRLRVGVALAPFALLAGCGGGGGGAVSTPPPPAASTPAPTPAPTPAAVFDTPEYRRSDGPAFHNAVAAWQRGDAGQGVTIGIVDTGIDPNNPEFAGRISSASADVAASRGITAEDDHGTDVALVAAAARNDSGVEGIAWQSTIMALRADSPGSCATPSTDNKSSCRFASSAIAAGVDRATQNGAKVINLSLGGPGAGASLTDAVARAAAAGVVVVVSAGNDFNDPTATDDPNNPEPFAMALRAAGNGNVIIAGSVDNTGTISSFSNRAGTEANWYLAALGEGICCTYENGALKVTTTNGQQFVQLFSGTSFSAPQIAGAVALLRQAFPNLTAAQTVDLLLRTARDAGAAGTDPVYGRGILDIASAFAPQGGTSVAGTGISLALADSTGGTSPAMGDAGRAATLRTVVLDGYGRAYRVDLGTSIRGSGAAPKLAGALVARTHEISAGGPGLALAFSVDGAGRVPVSASLRLTQADADSARVLAARMISQLAPDTRLGFAYAQNADGLVAALQDQDRPAFLLAASPLNDNGFTRSGELSFALRHRLGVWGLTVSADRGEVRNDTFALPGQNRWRRPGLGSASRLGVRLDRRLGGFDLALGASWLGEDRTILGASFNPALVGRGADSMFLDLDAAWRPNYDWRFGASLRRAWVHPRGGGLLAEGSQLMAQGWSLDIARSGVFAPNDSLALRVSQPLRVVAGGLDFDLPIAYDYGTLSATTSREHLSLVPRGRELIGELAWRGPLWGGYASTSLYYRKDPGNYAALPDEKGVAVSWSTGF